MNGKRGAEFAVICNEPVKYGEFISEIGRGNIIDLVSYRGHTPIECDTRFFAEPNMTCVGPDRGIDPFQIDGIIDMTEAVNGVFVDDKSPAKRF